MVLRPGCDESWPRTSTPSTRLTDRSPKPAVGIADGPRSSGQKRHPPLSNSAGVAQAARTKRPPAYFRLPGIRQSGPALPFVVYMEQSRDAATSVMRLPLRNDSERVATPGRRATPDARIRFRSSSVCLARSSRPDWRLTPIAAARLVRRARPLERRSGHLAMRRIRCRDCVPRTGREPRATSWLGALKPAVVCTLPWRCDSAAGAGASAEAIVPRTGRARFEAGENARAGN